MVDPNRKINRFTDRDIEFLEECEQEFSFRYGKEDAEFMEHCAKPLADPPIIENWSFGGGGNGSGSGGDVGGLSHPYQQHRGGNRNHRSWRGNGGGGAGGSGHRNFRPRRGGRGGGGGGRHYGDQNGYDHRDQNPRREPYPSNRPPMNIRRDYGNFVAASKENS